MEHVQVTRSLTNGFSMIGGAVELKYLAGFNNTNSDFVFSRGNVSLGQFLLSLRNDLNAYNNTDPQLSNGILIENHPFNTAYATGTQTHPVLSNVSIFGPEYCERAMEDSLPSAIRVIRNGAGGFYNGSVLGLPFGLYVGDASTILNANNGLLSIAYSSFYRNNDHFESLPTNFNQTGTFCVSTIDNWMTSSGSCVQDGNEVLFSSPGYHNSICNETYCVYENRPDFVLVTNNMGDPDFSSDPLDNVFFETDIDGIEYRGAFGETDWTADWTDWCAQETNYCPELQQQKGSGNRLNIAPNPSSGTAYALFDAGQAGKVLVNVLDKVSGQVLRSSNSNIPVAGAQQMAIPVDGLQAGVYIVQVVLSDGNVLSGQLFVL